MATFVRRHPLVSFVALAYLGSWLIWSPWWLSASGLDVLPWQPTLSQVAGINQLGMFAGPFAAALLVTWAAEGRSSVGRLLGRLLQWRAHPGWYLVALAAIPVATAVGYFLTPADGLQAPGGTAATLTLLASSFVVYLMGGPLQEEIGWRGVALPRLQSRLAPLPSALVLGVIHCLWHAPLFLTTEWDTARHEPSQLLAYLLLVVSLSVVLCWVHDGSGGSLLLAVLGHNALNWALLVAGTLTGREVESTWPAALGLGVLALFVALGTHGRLGHTERTRSTSSTERRGGATARLSPRRGAPAAPTGRTPPRRRTRTRRP